MHSDGGFGPDVPSAESRKVARPGDICIEVCEEVTKKLLKRD